MDHPRQTWDGKPLSSDPPYGASIVVYRVAGGRFEFLLLHRAHDGPNYEGDWAWTPPSGGRQPGESIEECAQRELREEAGLEIPVAPVSGPDSGWAVFLAKAGDSPIHLHDAEHDRFEWLSLDAALARLRPDRAREGFIRGVSSLGVLPGRPDAS